MNNAFRQYVFSGLSVRAYAARFGISVATLLRAITGGDVPPELADPFEVREVLKAEQREALYVAMQGPRGSVRWHQWAVEPDVGLAILNDTDEFREIRQTPGRLFLFPTVDHLVVAINPEHIVTAMFGNEDTGFLLEQRALVPSLLVSGHRYLPENQTKVLQEVHDALKLWVDDPNFDVLSDLPGYADARPSLAYLRDLKTPFEDHLWRVGGAVDLSHETLCSQLGSAIHIDDEFCLPTSAPIIDHDGMKTHVLFSLEQTSVLQCSRWTIERTALERMRMLVEAEGESADRDRLTPEMIQIDCRALGLYGVDEIEQYAAAFKEVLDKSVAAAPPKKRRGRPRKVVEVV